MVLKDTMSYCLIIHIKLLLRWRKKFYQIQWKQVYKNRKQTQNFYFFHFEVLSKFSDTYLYKF